MGLFSALDHTLGRVASTIDKGRSYFTNPSMLRAKGVASGLANRAWTGASGAARSWRGVSAMAGGAAIGVGYDSYNNGGRSPISSGLMGAAGGLGALMGYRGYKNLGGYAGIRAGAGRVSNLAGGSMSGGWNRLRREVGARAMYETRGAAGASGAAAASRMKNVNSFGL